MKINFKSFIVGAMSAVLLISVPAIASSVMENIEVARNTIKVTVDGKKLDADNFIYNGTTYVPIRAVAESIGLGVEYDEENHVAKIMRDCSFKFGGVPMGNINGYLVTEDMYAAYETFVKANGTYDTAEALDSAVKAAIKENVYIIQIANALDMYIESSFNKNYINLVEFMEMQYGGEEAFVKEIRSKGYSDEMYRHIQEINQLKADILGYEELAQLSSEDKEKFLEELLADFDKEASVKWE